MLSRLTVQGKGKSAILGKAGRNKWFDFQDSLARKSPSLEIASAGDTRAKESKKFQLIKT